MKRSIISLVKKYELESSLVAMCFVVATGYLGCQWHEFTVGKILMSLSSLSTISLIFAMVATC